MEEKKQPFVLIDRDFPDLSVNFVGVDDEAAGRIATEHLLNIGCQRVAHIRGAENSTGIGRYKGYQSALLNHGLPELPEYVVNRNTSIQIAFIKVLRRLAFCCAAIRGRMGCSVTTILLLSGQSTRFWKKVFEYLRTLQ